MILPLVALAALPQIVEIPEVSSPRYIAHQGGSVFMRSLQGGGYPLYRLDEDSGSAIDLGAVPGDLQFTFANWSGFWQGRYTTLSGDLGPVVSNGNPGGARLVLPLETLQDYNNFRKLARVGDLLFCVADLRDLSGWDLLVTDGISATPTVLDLDDSFLGPGSIDPSNLTEHQGRLFFRHTTAASGSELWVSDGTASGTGLVIDLAPGPVSGCLSSIPFSLSLQSDGELLWFAGTTAEFDADLFATDGTAAGTRRVFDTPVGEGPRYITRFANRVAFRAGPTPQSALWAVDIDTSVGEQITVVPEGLAPMQVNSLEGVPESLWLYDYTSISAVPAFLISDGTNAGTVSIDPGLELGAARPPLVQVGTDGSYVFQGTGPGGTEPWFTDGTPEGTFQVMDLAFGAQSSNPVGFVAAGSRALFESGAFLGELYSIDLTQLDVASLHPLGSGCPGAPLLSGAGEPRPGNPVDFELAGGAPGQLGFLLSSPTVEPLPGVWTCGLGLSAPKLLLPVALDAAGDWGATVTVPQNPLLAGRLLRLQAVLLESGGPLLGEFETTRLLEALIGG